jgi:hypothetical protein
MMTRNIGIIGDGATDLEIFSKTVECILLNNTSRLLDFKCTKLTQRSLHNSVEHYLRHTTRENEYSLVSRYAQELQKDVADLLLGALTDFEKILGIGLCNHDILLLTTDAERSFSKPEDYFQNWRLSLSKNLEVGIRKILYYYGNARLYASLFTLRHFSSQFSIYRSFCCGCQKYQTFW